MGAYIDSLIASGYGGYAGWTNDLAAENNFKETGGRGKETRTPGTSTSSMMSATTTGVQKDPNYPQFSFDWTAAENEALEKLKPYYKAKLDEAGGDVKLAKVRIKIDYDTGNRYREEDLGTQLAADKRVAEQEFRDTTTDLNRRGMLFGEMEPGTEEQSKAPYGDIAQRFFLNPMSEKQSARKLAIERAIGRQGEVAETTRKRGVEDIDIAFPRYERELGQEKQEKAILQMAPLSYQQSYGKYQALLSKYNQGGA